jgi:hypothetical protein
MSRAGEAARVGKLRPLRAASLEESIKLHFLFSGKGLSNHWQKQNLESRAKKRALSKVPHLKCSPFGRGEENHQ